MNCLQSLRPSVTMCKGFSPEHFSESELPAILASFNPKEQATVLLTLISENSDTSSEMPVLLTFDYVEYLMTLLRPATSNEIWPSNSKYRSFNRRAGCHTATPWMPERFPSKRIRESVPRRNRPRDLVQQCATSWTPSPAARDSRRRYP